MSIFQKFLFFSSVFVFVSCGVKTSELSQMMQAQRASEIQDQNYLTCENIKITQSKNGLSIYGNKGVKIIDHDRTSVSFRTAPSTSAGLKQCGVPIEVSAGGKYGLVMPDGTLFSGELLENYNGLYKDTLAFSENEKWGLINKSGEVIVQPAFNELRWYGGGKFIVNEREDTAFLIDSRGQHSRLEDDPNYSMKYRQHLPPRQAYLECNDNLRLDSRDGKWGIVNNRNEVVIPFKYRALSCTFDGKIMAAIDSYKLWCPIDTTQTILDNTKCKVTHYNKVSHHYPESFAENKYESSVLWNKAFLDYGKGLISEPPKYMPDGYRGRNIRLAAPRYTY